MIRYLALFLLPLTAAAQFTFGPLRLDDESVGRFCYPSVEVTNDDTLRCMWSSISEFWLSTMGQQVAPNGDLLGARIPYEVVPVGGSISCPAIVSFTRLSNRGTAQLIFHT
ncbi:hypothetical protein EHM69_00620 [candidate division KSB1 bacterium]|nr:MAG: hypothetical protein EHM69_00620 [candidate division KSB1 bacterium]